MDASLAKPIALNSTIKSWKHCKYMILSWLPNEDLAISVTYIEIAQELCANLGDDFSQKNSPKFYQLKRMLVII